MRLPLEAFRFEMFPPSKNGGPIEADGLRTRFGNLLEFPPSKNGGPIEA